LCQILPTAMSSDKPLPFIYQFAAGRLLPLRCSSQLKLTNL
jgi:hypothetical protein